MSTSAGSMLSFLRFRARRRSRAQCPAGPEGWHPASREPLGPGLGALVRVPAHSAPTAAMPCVASAPGVASVAGVVPVVGVASAPVVGVASVPVAGVALVTGVALVPGEPCAPPPTMLARTLPDAALLTPAATIPTVLVPVMRTPGNPSPGQEAPGEGGETTTLPSRQDAPATTIHPRRAR